MAKEMDWVDEEVAIEIKKKVGSLVLVNDFPE